MMRIWVNLNPKLMKVQLWDINKKEELRDVTVQCCGKSYTMSMKKWTKQDIRRLKNKKMFKQMTQDAKMKMKKNENKLKNKKQNMTIQRHHPYLSKRKIQKIQFLVIKIWEFIL